MVVTGGASGIGRACASGLAAAGRPVAVWDRDGAGARRVANQCADEHGVRAVGSEVDVTVTGSLRAAVRRARTELGPVGGLVHAAGIGGAVPVTQIDDESWDAVLDVNLRAGATLTRALHAGLVEANPGSAIVFISSIEAYVGHSFLPRTAPPRRGYSG